MYIPFKKIAVAIQYLWKEMLSLKTSLKSILMDPWILESIIYNKTSIETSYFGTFIKEECLFQTILNSYIQYHNTQYHIIENAN